MPLVRQALAFNQDPRLKALNACYIAMGESKLGHWQEARQHYAMARHLDPECVLLERVAREFPGATSAIGKCE